MAGKARNVANREIPDNRFNKVQTNVTSVHCARRTNPSQKFSTTNSHFMSAGGGTFNGAFGSIEDSLDISSGILDITDDSTGAIKKRRVIHINPETGTTDTLIGIETDGEELEYQELILLGTNGDTITVTHSSGSVTGTQRAILCPDQADYVSKNNEAMYLIYDTSLTSWVLINNAGDNLGDHIADREIEFTNISAPASANRNIIFGETTNNLVLNSGSSGAIQFDINGTEIVKFDSGEINFTKDGSFNFNFVRNDLTPNDDDLIGDIYFIGNNDDSPSPVAKTFAKIETYQRDITAGTEDGGIVFKTLSAGSTTTQFEINSNKLGFFGATPVTQRSAYTVTNHITDRSYDANSTSVAELADVLGTLLVDLRSLGLIAT